MGRNEKLEFNEKRSAMELLESALVEVRFGKRLSKFKDEDKIGAIEEAKQGLLVEFLRTANEKERAYVVNRILGKPSDGKNLKEELKEEKSTERTDEDEQELFAED